MAIDLVRCESDMSLRKYLPIKTRLVRRRPQKKARIEPAAKPLCEGARRYVVCSAWPLCVLTFVAWQRLVLCGEATCSLVPPTIFIADPVSVPPAGNH